MKEAPVKIYTPDHLIKGGLHVWVEMIGELGAYRHLIWRLMARDIAARYRQSVLGIFWSFLNPLLLMVMFVWAKNNQMLPIEETPIPYAAYVFLGQMLWFLFSQGVTGASASIVGASSLLTKINFPKEILVISALGQTIIDFLLRIPLLFIIFFWTGFTPHVSILFVPFVILPLILLILGIGFFLSLFNAIIRDIGNALSFILTIGMLATPVIYPPPKTGALSFWINHANPVSGILIAVQDLISLGYMHDPAAYVSSVVFSILLFCTGWRIFHLVEPRIAERI